MPCHRPILGWRDDRDGKVRPGLNLVVQPQIAPFSRIPCGSCLGCMADTRTMWAMRFKHESSTQDEAMFLTLTYRDADLPQGSELVKSDVQDFVRSYRKRTKSKIRYAAVGEYGGRKKRPHYHLVMWGKKLWEDARVHDQRNRLWTSKKIEAAWKKGYAPFGSVTTQSAEYVAGYVFKKIYATKMAARMDGMPKEFSLHSTKPGIGRDYFDKHWKTIYAHDSVIYRGRERRPPRRYDIWLQEDHPETWEEVRLQRTLKAYDQGIGQTEEEILRDAENRRMYQEAFMRNATKKKGRSLHD